MDNIITDRRLNRIKVTHAMTTAAFGHMKLKEKIDKFLVSQNVPIERTLLLKQIHSDNFLTIENEKDFLKYKAAKYEADGWIITHKNCVAAIYTADCAPLFLWDKSAAVISLAHCGWRSAALGLPLKILKKMLSLKKTTRPISAFIAPHIKKCCFEVGADTARYFPKTAKKNNNGKFSVDLAKEIKYQLISGGIAPVDIKIHSECTCCAKEKYFSYRRTKTKLSMLSFVYLPK